MKSKNKNVCWNDNCRNGSMSGPTTSRNRHLFVLETKSLFPSEWRMPAFRHWLVTRDRQDSISNEFFYFAAGRWPHLLPLVYTIQALLLIPLRFFIYKRKSWHYFGRTKSFVAFWSAWLSLQCTIFCYFVNLLTLVYLWILPSSKNSLRRMLQFQSWTGCAGPSSSGEIHWFFTVNRVESMWKKRFILL